jgi:hypothetical protein
VLLIPFIPHRQVKDDTGKESALGDTQKESRGKEAGIVVDDSHKRGDDAPEDGERRQPLTRAGLFQNDVAGNFEDHISDEVERETGQILVAG